MNLEDAVQSATLIKLELTTPAADRHTPDHRADFVPCRDFHLFEPRFEEVQAALESEERKALPKTAQR